jgi:hypothetical protein
VVEGVAEGSTLVMNSCAWRLRVDTGKQVGAEILESWGQRADGDPSCGAAG